MRLHLIAIVALLACSFATEANASPGLGVAPVPRIVLSPSVELAVSPHIFGDPAIPNFFEGNAHALEQAPDASATVQVATAPAATVHVDETERKPDVVAQIIGLAVTMVLLPLITWLFALLRSYILAHVKSTTVAGILTRLDSFVEVQVRNMTQTFVDDMKATNGWNPALGAKVKADVLAQVKSHLGAQGLAEISGVLGVGNVETFLGAAIEAKVHEVNAAPAAA